MRISDWSSDVCSSELDAREALIMAEVEVGLCPVVGHIDLAVLIGRHRARIDVQIGIELPDTDTIAARLQQSREASRHQTFAKRGDHAAGDKNEPRHGRKDLLNGRGTAQAVESLAAENISAGRFWSEAEAAGYFLAGG